MDVKFGLLLPHFGEHANRENLIRGTVRAEELGFHSVWVRDHLIFEPHGEMETPNRTFFDALTTLTAVGAVTQELSLGTGCLIPFRHPLHTALIVATMSHVVGPRVILGIGAGTFGHEFDAIALGHQNRVDLVRSYVEVLRRVWTENGVSYKDDNYEFEDVTIEPKPRGGVPPLWYCGGTPASARRAVEYADGWMPGRISLRTMESRIRLMDELAEERGGDRPTIAVIPPTSVDRDPDAAVSHVNVEGLLRWANKAKYALKPPSGRFETVQDLEGQLIVGGPDDVVRECKKFESIGTDHLVFDLRFRFDDWFEQIELLGNDVLPALR